jgi:hypothetical protein
VDEVYRGARAVKVFLISVVFTLLVAFGAEQLVTHFAQESSEDRYAAHSTRP